MGPSCCSGWPGMLLRWPREKLWRRNRFAVLSLIGVKCCLTWGFSLTTACLSAAHIVERAKGKNKPLHRLQSSTQPQQPSSSVSAESCSTWRDREREREKKNETNNGALCNSGQKFYCSRETCVNVNKFSNAPAFVFFYVLPAIRGFRNRALSTVEKFARCPGSSLWYFILWLFFP